MIRFQGKQLAKKLENISPRSITEVLRFSFQLHDFILFLSKKHKVGMLSAYEIHAVISVSSD